MTFRYGIVTVRVRQPLGGFTGTARGGRPAVGSRLCWQRSTPHARSYQPDLTLSRRYLSGSQQLLRDELEDFVRIRPDSSQSLVGLANR
jgi:hypothetical protein